MKWLQTEEDSLSRIIIIKKFWSYLITKIIIDDYCQNSPNNTIHLTNMDKDDDDDDKKEKQNNLITIFHMIN